MQQFELLGNDGDETRILRAPACNYRIALAGRPRIAPPPPGPIRYDIVIALDDVGATHGFRIDELPGQMRPDGLAFALLTAYGKNRNGGQDVRGKPLPFAAPWRLAGNHAIYPLANAAEPTMEQLWIELRAAPGGYWALHHTTWFPNSKVNNLQWGHLRASFIDQHAWDDAPPSSTEVPQIWPFSAIAMRSANLSLTPAALEMMRGKARDLGAATSDQGLAVLELLRPLVHADDSPRAPIDGALTNEIWKHLQDLLGPRLALPLLVGLDDCKTRHDLRGWVWQQVLAIGNRPQAR